jgi:hypothetical protein
MAYSVSSFMDNAAGLRQAAAFQGHALLLSAKNRQRRGIGCFNHNTPMGAERFHKI